MRFEHNSEFRGTVDFLLNQMLNAVLQTFSTEPTGTTADGQTVPIMGMIGYNTVTNKFGYYNGTAWYYPGAGDMLKSVYDTNNNGNVDTADNALLLQGQNAAYFLNLANATGVLNLSALPSHASTHKLGGTDIIRLNELAIPTGTVNMNGYKIVSMGDGTADTDAATLGQLKQYIQGARYKAENVRCVASSNITLSGFQTIDGITLASGDANLRVLVAGQTTASQNGIYQANSGAWARTTDADTWDELVSACVIVEQGTVYADSQWMCIVDRGGVLGTTTINWKYLPSLSDIVAGAGLIKTGNTVDINPDGQSVEIVGDAVQVKLDAAGGIVKNASGIKANLDANSLEVSSNAIQVKLNPAGAITKSASGVGVNVGTGLVVTSNYLTLDDAYKHKAKRMQFTITDTNVKTYDITTITGGVMGEAIGLGGARIIQVYKRSGTLASNYKWSQIMIECAMQQGGTSANIYYRIEFAKNPTVGDVYEVIVLRSYVA